MCDSSGHRAIRDGVIGCWLLEGSEYVTPDGCVALPLGASPIGQLIYDRCGRMSVQMSRGLKPNEIANDYTQDDYIGYFGLYHVYEDEKAIVHEIECGTSTSLVGTTQSRYVRELNTERLVLEAEAGEARIRNVFARYVPH